MPNLNFDLARPNSDEPRVMDVSQARVNWPVVNHLLDATRYWLEEIDVDGYRLDVASDVPFWFWEMFRKTVKEAKPDAYIVGELWGASPEYVNGRYYDAVMNYKFFRDPVLSFFGKGEMTADEFDRAIAPGRMIYAQEGVQAQMNLLDSHDTERFLTTAGGDIRRIKLAFLFGTTYVGAPTIYYGDEIAMTGRHDPDCRRPFLWNYTDDPRRVELHDYVRSLTRIRREHPCLVHGAFRTLHADGSVFVYQRGSGPDRAIVALNAGTEEAEVTIPVDHGIKGWVGLIGGGRYTAFEDSGSEVRIGPIPPLSGLVIVPAE
jgi:glycosidase